MVLAGVQLPCLSQTRVTAHRWQYTKQGGALLPALQASVLPSPLRPDGPWPPGGSIAKPCGLLSQAGGERSGSLAEPLKGLLRRALGGRPIAQSGMGEGPLLL